MKNTLLDGIIEHGQISALTAAFSLQGRGFRLFLAAKAEGVDTFTAPNLIAYGDTTAKPCPLVVGQWSESFIKEIPIAAIDLTEYDLFYGLTEPSQYEVRFDLDGGSMELPHVVTINYNTTVAEPAEEPTREGYTFDGWKSNGETHDFEVALTDNATIVAAWIANFVVTFDGDGGTETEPQEITSGSTATEPADPTRTGYTFDGWYNGETLYNFATPVTEALTLTAHWLENFTVTFDSDGGSAVAPQEVADGDTASEPITPTLEGHALEGWNLGEAPYNFATPVTGDITLTAVWVEVFQVTFDSQGGSAVAAQDVNDGETATEPTPDPTKEGFTLDRWSIAVDGAAFNFATPITADLTLYAIWTE